MHFSIDGKLYSVAIAGRPLRLGGEPCNAKVDHERKRIWLSDQLSPAERRRELFHELRHCWVEVRGRASADDAEADAIDAGEMMDLLLAQYGQQGGDATLEALVPESDPLQTRAFGGGVISWEPPRCMCGAPVALGSVTTSPPTWSAELGMWLVDRGFLCAVCDQVNVWREVSNGDGMPLGSILSFPPPRMLKGADAARWIGDHADVCRVVML